LATAVSAKVTQTELEFVNWLGQFGKSYDTVEEFNLRFALFTKFDAEVKEINAKETTSRHSNTFFADMTAAEKTAMMGLKNMPRVKKTPTPEAALDDPRWVGIPTSVNWVSAGKVNAIQN